MPRFEQDTTSQLIMPSTSFDHSHLIEVEGKRCAFLFSSLKSMLCYCII